MGSSLHSATLTHAAPFKTKQWQGTIYGEEMGGGGRPQDRGGGVGGRVGLPCVGIGTRDRFFLFTATRMHAPQLLGTHAQAQHSKGSVPLHNGRTHLSCFHGQGLANASRTR
jgi:hypothetical protein